MPMQPNAEADVHSWLLCLYSRWNKAAATTYKINMFSFFLLALHCVITAQIRWVATSQLPVR